MRLVELNIDNYGPLKGLKINNFSNFNLIWGFNESGKTLTVEALIRFLLGRKANVKSLNLFENLERVDEYPNGYCVFEYTLKDGTKTKIKFPQDKFFVDVLSQKFENKFKKEYLNLSIKDFRNIFIIRNSDLIIPEENNFYIDITSKLTGLNSNLIKNTIDEIRKISNLTEKDNFKNTEGLKLKSRMDNSKRLIEKISLYKNEIKQNQYDELEKKYFFVKQKIKILKEKVKDLENARNKEKYLNSKNIIEKIESNLKKINDFKNIKDNDFELWKKMEQKIEILNKNELSIKNEISNLENSINELENLEDELDQKNNEFNYKEQVINQIVSPSVEEYKKNKAKFEGLQVKLKNLKKVFKKISLILFVLIIISSIIPVFNFINSHLKLNFFNFLKIIKDFKNINILDLFITFLPILFIFILFILAIIFLINLINWFRMEYIISNKQSNLKKNLEIINFKLKELALNGGNIDNILMSLDRFRQEKKIFDEKFNKFNFELEAKRDKLHNDLNNKLQDIIGEYNMLESEIERIKKNSNISTLKEYEEKIMQKTNLKLEISNLLSSIIAILDLERQLTDRGKRIISMLSYSKDFLNSKEFFDLINFIKKNINNLKVYETFKKDIKYSEELYNKLNIDIENFVENLDEIETKLKLHRSKLAEIEREAINIFGDGIFCSTSDDLDEINRKLENFIKENEIVREDAIDLISILTKIDNEEKEKIKNIIDDNKELSSMFRKLSNNRYKEVIYEMDENINQSSIFVKTKDDIVLDVNKLSSGTFDQLYFLLRVTIANMLMQKEKGFFIFDDPFIKSDPVRLKIMLDWVIELSKKGWQILYFSSKGEVKETLKNHINSKNINLIEIKKI